jgi:hypothetical protein
VDQLLARQCMLRMHIGTGSTPALLLRQQQSVSEEKMHLRTVANTE